MMEAIDILNPLGISITEAARIMAEAHKVLEGVDFSAKHIAQEIRRVTLQSVILPELVTRYLEAIEGQKSKCYVDDLPSFGRSKREILAVVARRGAGLLLSFLTVACRKMGNRKTSPLHYFGSSKFQVEKRPEALFARV